VSDDRFDGGAPAQLAFDGLGEAAPLARDFVETQSRDPQF